MSQKAFHFSLTRDHAKRLFGCRDAESLAQFIGELSQSKATGDEDRGLVSADIWPVLHRCLSGGTLDPTGGEFPLNHAFLGGRMLSDAGALAVVLVRPDAVPVVAAALMEITPRDLKRKFDDLNPGNDDAILTRTNFEQLWDYFQLTREFFHRAAQRNESVVFAEVQ